MRNSRVPPFFAIGMNRFGGRSTNWMLIIPFSFTLAPAINASEIPSISNRTHALAIMWLTRGVRGRAMYLAIALSPKSLVGFPCGMGITFAFR